MSSRPRRSSGKKRAALDQFRESKELQRQGVSRLDQLAMEDDDGSDGDGGLYKVVDEESYRDLVKQRREQGDFVVDDDGTGYMDDGEEPYWQKRGDGDASSSEGGDKDHEEDPEAAARKRKNDAKKRKKRRVEEKAVEAKAQSRSLNDMFGKMAQRGSGAGPAVGLKSKRVKEQNVVAQDDSFDTMLADLVSDPVVPTTNKKKKSRVRTFERRSGVKSEHKRGRDSSQKPSSSGVRQQTRREQQQQRDDDDEYEGGAMEAPSISDVDMQGAAAGEEEEEEIQRKHKPNKSNAKQAKKQKTDDDDENAADDSSDVSATAADASPPKDSSTEEDEKKDIDNVNKVKKEHTPKPALSAKAKLLMMARNKPIKTAPAVLRRQAEEAANAKAAAEAAAKAPFPSALATAISLELVQDSSWQQAVGELDNNSTTVAKVASAPMGANTVAESMIQKDEDGDAYLDVFWLDMFEDTQSANGTVYVIGKALDPKTNQHVSCSIRVSNMERVLYVLPRTRNAATGDAVESQDVYAEVQSRLNMMIPAAKGREFRCKMVERDYAFEVEGVPREKREYLKVKYQMAAEDQGSQDWTAGDTFSHVFGSRQSAIERLVLSRDLMGPCWVRMNGLKLSERPVSWCRLDAEIDNPKAMERLKKIAADKKEPAPPPLRVMSLRMQAIVNKNSHKHEVVMVSVMCKDSYKLEGTTVKELESGQDLTYFTAICAPNSKSAVEGAGTSIPLKLKREVKENPKMSKHLSIHMNERALLNYVVQQVHRLDPDVVLGHNIAGFGLDVLVERMRVHRVEHWSKLGRLKRSRIPNSSKGFAAHANLTPGRLLLDTYLTARELLFGQRNYTLTELCRTQLSSERVEVEPQDVPFFFNSYEQILELVRHNQNDAWLAFRLAVKLEALPLTMQLTCLGGNLWRRTLAGGRAERIEYLLLHEFHRRKYIIPDKKKSSWAQKEKAKKQKSASSKAANKNAKSSGAGANGGVGDLLTHANQTTKPQSNSAKRKPAYAGGLVLEPKKGLYDKYVLLLDFNSLYPSIIQEYNICFTTVDRPATDRGDGSAIGAAAAGADAALVGDLRTTSGVANEDGADDAQDAQQNVEAHLAESDPSAIPPLPDRSKHPDLAVLPTVIKSLVERRKLVKNMIKKEVDPVVLQRLDVRQKALKITANSMYGCLGFSNSRFFARPLAALVTSQGRDILQTAVTTAEGKCGLEVIYGDTDSIMINTNSTDLVRVKEMAGSVKREINKLYKLLEIEMDGIYKMMLLLKKKKYAALMIVEERQKDGTVVIKTEKETKGLDLVRRDWCPLSRTTGQQCLDHIFSGGDMDAIVEGVNEVLEAVREAVNKPDVGIEQFVVTKGLNKAPKDYPNAKGQAHLVVATAMVKAGKRVNTGDHIPYVICTTTRVAYEAEAAAAVEAAASAARVALADAAGAAGAAGDNDAASKMDVVHVAPPLVLPSSAGQSKSFALRAFHPDEVKRSNGKLKIDIEWYLAQQVLPPVSRLCDPISGITSGELAERLGLDPKKFSHVGSSGGRLGDDEDDSLINMVDVDDAERFRNCERVPLTCKDCGVKYVYPGVVWRQGERDELQAVAKQALTDAAVIANAGTEGNAMKADVTSHKLGSKAKKLTKPADKEAAQEIVSGLQCPCCLTPVDATALGNALQLAARGAVRQYYGNWNCVDDDSADVRTRQQSVRGSAWTQNGRRMQLRPEYSARALYTQLKYVESLADVARAETNNVKAAEEVEKKHEQQQKQQGGGGGGGGMASLEVVKAVQSALGQSNMDALKEVQVQVKKDYIARSAYCWIKPEVFHHIFNV